MIAPGKGNQIAESVRIVGDRVKVEIFQKGPWRLMNAVLGLGPDLVSMFNSPKNKRELSAAVSQDDLKAGEFLKGAAEDQPGCSDGGVQRVSDKIVEIKIEEPVQSGHMVGM